MKKTIAKIALASMILSIGTNGLTFADGITTANPNAWGENTGWINFDPVNGNIDITASGITGNAWGETTGWINMQPTNGGVTNTCAGVLGGTAWAQSHGWISFSGATIDANGFFQGTATDSQSGTINFSGTNYALQTDWRPNCDFDTIVYQAPTQDDPTADGTATFRTVFTEAIDVASFVASDITLAGTTGTVTSGPTEVSPNDGTTFEFTVTGMTETETVTASIAAGVVDSDSTTAVNKVSITDTTGIHDIFGDGSSVATYNFDSDATDLGGNYDGTATGGLLYSAGKYSNAATFDEINDYIEIDDNEFLKEQDFSLSTTFKLSNLQTVDHIYENTIFSHSTNSNYSGYRLAVSSNGSVYFRTAGPSGGNRDILTNSNVNVGDGEFHHVSVSIKNNVVELYVDNTVVTSTFQDISFVSNMTALVGFESPRYLPGGSNPAAGYYFGGQIDQFRVFNKALNLGEIQVLGNEIPDREVTYPEVPDFDTIVYQAPTQDDPTADGTATFRAVFTEAVDTASFTAADITLAGTTGTVTSGPTEVSPNDGTTFEFTVTGMAETETVTATIAAGVVDSDSTTAVNKVSITDTTGIHDIFGDGSSVATYNFNGDATDLGGNYDGTGSGGVTYSTGKYGTAMTLDGVDDFIDLTVIPASITGSDWSYSMNVKFDELTSDGTLFNGRDADTSQAKAGWLKKNGDKLQAITKTPGDNNTVKTSGVLFTSTSEYYNIIFSKEGTEYRFYVNGQIVNELTTTKLTTTEITDNSVFAILGKHRYSLNTNNNFLEGSIDQFRVFDKALNDDEISLLYTETLDNEVTYPDVTAPGVPVVTGISEDTGTSATDYNTSDNTIEISGTAEANSTVEVYINGIKVGEATADANGDWTFDYTGTTLADANYDVTVKGVDAAGNESVQSNIIDVEIDTTAPSAVAITSPEQGESTNDTTPLVEGTGEPGATVNVVSGSSSCTATVNASGIYSCELAPALTEGNHTISVTQTDTAGNISPATTTDIEVDTTFPNAATVDTDLYNTDTPSITGDVTLGTGETLSVTVNGKVYTQTDPELTVTGGTWTLAIPTADALTDGTYNVDAVVTDSAGNATTDVSTSEISIDTTAPDAPVVTSPTDGTTTNDTTPAFVGTGEIGAVITVTDGNGHTCSDTVDASGNWSCNISPALTDSTTATFTTTQTDTAGNTSAGVDVDVTIDTTAPTAPTVDNLLDNSATPTISGMVELNTGETLTVEVNGVTYSETDPELTVTGSTWELIIPTGSELTEGTYDVIATVTDAANNATTDTGTDEITLDLTDPATPTIDGPTNGSPVTGTAEPESTVVVTTPSGATCTTQADTQGNYSCTLSPAPVNGEDVTATSTDPAGNSSDVTETAGIDTLAPADPDIDSPTQGSPVTGTAEPNTTIVLTTPSGSSCTTTVDANGDFSCDLEPDPVDGETLTSSITDAAGNTTTSVAPNAIDLTAPGVPVVTGISEDTGSSAIDNETSDNTIEVSGTAEANSTVEVYVNGISVGTTPVDANGDWTFDYTSTTLTDGNYDVTVRGIDASGNESVQSNIIDVEIDTISPNPVTINTPNSGTATNDTTPLVEGTGEPGATVNVVSGSSSCTATVNASGIYSCELAPALTEGNHTISVTQTDTAGNTSPATTTDIEVDTSAPTPATVDIALENSATPDITGTIDLQPGEILSVIVDGVVYTLLDGNLTLAGDEWTLSIPSENTLTDGEYEVEAIITDAAGNSSTDISVAELSIDTTAPTTPVVTSPTDGTTTNDTTPAFAGTGEIGAVITVTDGNGHTCSDTVDASGNWSCNISGALTDGTTATFTTTQTDTAGNTSVGVDVDVTIDTTAPTAPTVDNLLDNSVTPTISGMVELNTGETLTVEVNGVTYSETDPELTVTGSTWELIIPGTAPLTDGVYNVIATVTDAANNTTTDTGVDEITIDATAPATPTIDEPTNGSPVTGTAEPESTVVVTTPSGATCTTTADSSGNYSCVLAPTPVDGEDVTATSTDAAGNTASETIPSGIDTTAPSTPTLISPTQGAPVVGTAEPEATVIVSTPSGATCETTADANGNYSCTLSPTPEDGETVSILTIDGAGNTSLLTIPNAIDITAPTSTTLNAPTNGAPVTGTAEPGTSINITTPSGATCTAIANASGNYSCELSPSPTDGEDAIITTTDSAGNYTSIIETNAIDTVVPVDPTITQPLTGENSNDNTPSVIGTAEAGSTVEIYVDGAKVGETVADANGNYSYTLSELSDGEYDIQVTSIDPAGNQTGLSTAVELTVDTLTPGIVDGSLNVDASETVATITWETTELTSSEILYGLTQIVDQETGEFDIAPRVTTHSLTLNNLLSCTTYFYKTVSIDASENVTTAGIYNFTTKGCIADASVTQQETTTVVPNTTGTTTTPLSIGSTTDKLEIEVPAGYNATDTCVDGGAYFQMKEIDKERVTSSLGRPEGSDQTIRTYDLSAYCTTGERVEDFDERISITASYAGQGIFPKNERFTKLHSYNTTTSKWEVLEECSVNEAEDTVTCFTPHFSTFGIFTQEVYSENGAGASSTSSYKVEETDEVTVGNATSEVAANEELTEEVSEEEIDLTSAEEKEEEVDFIVVDDIEEEIQELAEIEGKDAIDIFEELFGEVESEETTTTSIEGNTEETILEKTKTVNGKEVSYKMKDNYSSCGVIENLLDETYDKDFYTQLKDIDFIDNRDFVERLEKAGVIDGDKNLFEGNRDISRVEFLKILMRSHCIEYRNADTSNLDFTDLDNNTWQAKVVKRSIELGIAHGDTDKNGRKVFRADDVISRVEALKLLMRMALVQSGREENMSYDDINLEWHLRYVAQGVELGILDPASEGYEFKPESARSRYSLTQLLERVITLYK